MLKKVFTAKMSFVLQNIKLIQFYKKSFVLQNIKYDFQKQLSDSQNCMELRLNFFFNEN